MSLNRRTFLSLPFVAAIAGWVKPKAADEEIGFRFTPVDTSVAATITEATGYWVITDVSPTHIYAEFKTENLVT